MQHKNFKSVDRCVYGRGSFSTLGEILSIRRKPENPCMVFIVDDVFQHGKDGLVEKLPFEPSDLLLFANADKEPTTEQVDAIRDKILAEKGLPSGVIGIGGGSMMDIAKATALMLTNPGKSEQYQGLNLIKIPGVYHVGIPTISGTAAEVSMTAVLTGPVKKLGLKCDYTFFDQIILDPDLIAGVPVNQWFYTGMDCYIHCVEALTGTQNNAFSRAYGEKALDMCRNIFLGKLTPTERDEQLMIASYFGGLSLTYSEVGVCHALSYGLGKVLGMRHGFANCVAFNHLQEIYGDYVLEFKEMVAFNKVDLPQGLSAQWDDQTIDAMTEVSWNLPHMWNHAFGANWQTELDKNRIKEWFRRM